MTAIETAEQTNETMAVDAVLDTLAKLGVKSEQLKQIRTDIEEDGQKKKHLTKAWEIATGLVKTEKQWKETLANLSLRNAGVPRTTEIISAWRKNPPAAPSPAQP